MHKSMLICKSVALSLTSIAALTISACSGYKAPSEQEGYDLLLGGLNKRDCSFDLARFEKTNGAKDGEDGYEIMFKATITSKKDGQSLTRCAFGNINFGDHGPQYLNSGQRIAVTGVLGLKMTEKGWRVSDIRW